VRFLGFRVMEGGDSALVCWGLAVYKTMPGTKGTDASPHDGMSRSSSTRQTTKLFSGILVRVFFQGFNLARHEPNGVELCVVLGRLRHLCTSLLAHLLHALE